MVESEQAADAKLALPPAPTRLTALIVFLVALLVLAAILNYVDRLAISAIAPTLKDKFNLNNQDWGWINSAFNLVYIFSSTLGGMWIDRVGVRKGLLISMVVWSLAAAGHALATDFWSLCAWRMLLAVGEGPGAASLLKGVRRLLPPQMRDAGNGLIGAGWAAGALIAPLLIGPITVKLGWEAAFLTTGGLCLVWIPFWLIFSSSRSVNLGAEHAQIAAGSDDAPQRLDFRSHAVQGVLLATFFTVVPTVFMNAFLALFLKDTYHLTQEQINGVQWKPFLATDIGQLGGGFVVYLLVRSGWKFLPARRLMLTIGFCGSALMFGVASAPDAQAAIGWICASRLFYQAAYTVLGVYGIESVHENQTALMAGLLNATFSISNFIFNPIIGGMSDRYGYAPVITMIGVAPLIGLSSWLVLSHLHARRADQPAPAEELRMVPAETSEPV